MTLARLTLVSAQPDALGYRLMGTFCSAAVGPGYLMFAWGLVGFVVGGSQAPSWEGPGYLGAASPFAVLEVSRAWFPGCSCASGAATTLRPPGTAAGALRAFPQPARGRMGTVPGVPKGGDGREPQLAERAKHGGLLWP